MTDVEAELRRGVELFNERAFWDAHEAWEQAWTPDRHGPDRGFYKGLIQVAAGYLHHSRGNRRGALIKWRSGADFLRPYLPAHHGVQLAPLVEAADRAREAVEESAGQVAVTPPLISVKDE